MLATVLALLSVAQPHATTAQSGDILVTGRKDADREAARRYVNDISRPVRGQLATFSTPVCPSVVGLPPEHGAVVVARIRKVAKHAGLTVADEGCSPNLNVVVVDSGRDLVEELYRNFRGVFSGIDRYDVAQVLDVEGPVRAWSVTQTRNADGLSYASKYIKVTGVSIVKPSVQQTVLGSFVVMDEDAVVGKSLTQIADYAAMRALAGAQPPQNSAFSDTILALFDDATPTLSITHADLAYMTELNRLPLQRLGVQRNRLSGAVTNAAARRAKQ